MIKGLYTTASGMIPRVLKQEIFANNMANANTVGYKKDGAFLHQLEDAKKNLLTDSDWEISMVDGVFTDFSQGFARKTENPLDIAIEGDGFFAVMTPQGERYTRAGEFSLSADGTLIDKNGYQVQGDGGQIVINGDSINISADGSISVDGTVVGKLKIVDFAKPYKLDKAENGYFMPAEPEIQPITDAKYELRQGYVEESNVNIVEQMVDMLVSFRAYEAGQKAIHAQDETLEKAVNQVGRVR
ncbi:MAG: flagellar basal-body rod protein FlgF [candidate division Zixibacteria bacterium]|nr:flagellar basal-body rod protein FlgF [candidate division Zixibacteria bacterium]